MSTTTNKTLGAICPLYGLGWVATDLNIGNNAVLRFVDLQNNENDEFTTVGLRAISYRCLIEIKIEYDPKDYNNDPWEDILNMAMRVESALRTYHEGRIGIAAIIYFENDQRQSARILDSFIPNGQEDYQINKAELEEFPTFLKSFEIAWEKKPVALQYFSHSQQRFANNDKAIDLCTVLESLFVPSNSRGAKKIFLTQGVRVLGFNETEIAIISDLYDYRNTIVHGDHNERAAIYTRNKGSYTLQWFEDCENLIRKILQQYINKPWQ